MTSYGTDLSYIHDAGFTGYVLAAVPGLLDLLRRHGIRNGLVVDLGCGSGAWAARLTAAGYEVLGIDLSPAMIALARRQAPRARFAVASLFQAELPQCVAVTAIGECLNYAFDRTNSKRSLAWLFARVYGALAPGGIFAFDVAEPGQPTAALARRFVQTDDWSVLVQAEEARGVLVREITTYRRLGKRYRRSDETHRLRLWPGSELAEQLRAAGFAVTLRRAYGSFRLPPAHAVLIARKPG